MSNPFNYAMTNNPFILEERRGNRELRAKARNTRRQELQNLRTRRLNAGDKARNLKQKLKMARFEGNTATAEQLAANYDAARKNEEELAHKINRFKMQGIYNGIKERNNRREKLVKNVIKQAEESKTDNIIKKINLNIQERKQRSINRLHEMPKHNALSLVDGYIQAFKNISNKGLQTQRNNVAARKRYTENEYGAKANAVLSAYDPSIDPTSPEGIALESAIQSQLNFEKKVRNATRKSYNTNLKNINIQEKIYRNSITRNIKSYETLRQDIQSGKFKTL